MKMVENIAVALAILALPVASLAGSANPMDLKRGVDAKSIELKAKKDVIRPALRLKMTCQVAGSPVEFPNDIFVANLGRVTMPAGKTVHWKITGTSIKGSAILPALAPGKGTYLQNAIPGGLTAGTPCTATAL